MERSQVGRGAAWMLTAFTVSIAGCGGDDPTGPGGGGGGGQPVATTAVNVLGSLQFDPPNIRVSPGATVTWTWASGAGTHNVEFPSTAIDDSGNLSSGTFSATMPTTPGTYNYSCTLHGGMSGSVLVQ